jgi:pimeloyl-ACP methyl ester carboxylesterase
MLNVADLPARRHARCAGLRIGWREAGAGTAPALVLLHGIGSTSTGWVEQLRALSRERRVIAWDAPGYADSEPLPQAAPAAGDYAQVLAALLDELGIAQACLVTNSLGTLMALALAALRPSQVCGLVLGAPTAGLKSMPSPQREQAESERIEKMRTLGPRALRAQEAERLVAPGTSEELLEFLRSTGDELTVDGYSQAARMLYSTDGVAAIARLEQPVHVICGSEDRITPPRDNALRLVDAARRATVESVERCGHMPHLEHPQRFNRAVERFAISLDR